MDAQQRIFTELLIRLRAAGYDVYDGYLPPDGVPYPFVYLGDAQTIDRRYKGERGGTVTQTIHIFHDDVDERGTLSALILGVKQVLWAIEGASGWRLSDLSTQVLPDDTTNKPLMHAVINAGFTF